MGPFPVIMRQHAQTPKTGTELYSVFGLVVGMRTNTWPHLAPPGPTSSRYIWYSAVCRINKTHHLNVVYFRGLVLSKHNDFITLQDSPNMAGWSTDHMI
jgi:hypothetical protein